MNAALPSRKSEAESRSNARSRACRGAVGSLSPTSVTAKATWSACRKANGGVHGLLGWGGREPLTSHTCNVSSIAGDGETLPWPPCSSRLDIEPQLVVVYRNAQRPVVGFCIFTDVSARDVQASAYPGVRSDGK